MTCLLGLENATEKGGVYIGEGIAKLISNIRKQLEADGFVGRIDYQKPHIIFKYTDEYARSLFVNHEAVCITELFESDSNFERVDCLGFGEDEYGGSKNSCKRCPYFQKIKISPEFS